MLLDNFSFYFWCISLGFLFIWLVFDFWIYSCRWGLSLVEFRVHALTLPVHCYFDIWLKLMWFSCFTFTDDREVIKPPLMEGLDDLLAVSSPIIYSFYSYFKRRLLVPLTFYWCSSSSRSIRVLKAMTIMRQMVSTNSHILT